MYAIKPGFILESVTDRYAWFPDELQVELERLIAEIRSYGDDPENLPSKFRALYDAMPSQKLDFLEYALDVDHHDEVVAGYREQDWNRYVMAHPDYLRIYAFDLAVSLGLEGEAYWRLLTSVYLDDVAYDDPGERKWAYARLYKADMPPGRRATMNAEELAVFDALPEVVTLYRTARHEERYGMSWTLERSVAESVAHDYRTDRNIYTVQVPRDAVVVYYSRRPEAGVPVNPVRPGAEVLVNLKVLSGFKVSLMASADYLSA